MMRFYAILAAAIGGAVLLTGLYGPAGVPMTMIWAALLAWWFSPWVARR